MSTYASMADFVAENAARLEGDELDFGVGWWDGDTTFPQYRLSWIEATGELYTLNLAHPAMGGGQVELLAEIYDEDVVRDKLDGWHELDRMRLDWVRHRLAGSNLQVVARLRAESSSMGESLAESVEAWERMNGKVYPDRVPYPGFCRHPERCSEAGRCSAESSCVD